MPIQAARSITSPLFRPALAFLLSGMLADFSSAVAVQQTLSEVPQLTDQQKDFVQQKVRPLLSSRCGECHGTQSEQKGGLSLVSRKSMLDGGDSGPVLVPFKPEESLLISAVKYEGFEMPPRTRLPEGEIQILEQWIRMGAPWQDSEQPTESARPEFPLQQRKAEHWAWQPVQRPEVPNATPSSWPSATVDRFILHALQQNQLSPAPEADRRSLIRRVYFDLIGLPPTIEQQERFYNDPLHVEQALATVVDELLNSPHFGERWGRHWLDLVRYAETLGHEFDYPLPYAWRYRDYVIRAINNDVPYDQFMMEHVAGDLLPTPRINPESGFNESIIGTGFWFLHEDKHAPVDVKAEEAARVDNQIDVFSRTFLGLTVACARCHDHKFDAISTRDYYALAGFLKSSRRRVERLDPQHAIHDAALAAAKNRRIVETLLRKDLQDWPAPELALTLQQALNKTDETAETAGDDTVSTVVQNLRDRLTSASELSVEQLLSLPARLMSIASAGEPEGDELRRCVANWCRQIQAAAAGRADLPSVVLADFRNGLPAGWLTYGPAFGDSATTAADSPSQDLKPEESASERPLTGWIADGPQVTSGDFVTSAGLARELTGILTSPAFELTHPEILVEAAGEASALRLVIDGYVMNEFTELLFSGAKQSVDTEGRFRWFRLAGDVHRYLGHRCWLELRDEGGGWFAVREIRMLNSAGGPEPSGEAVSAPMLQLAEQLLTICEQNSDTLTSDTVVRLWSESAVRDSHWPLLASQLNALPSQQSDEYRQALTAWREAAAAVPQGVPVLVMCDGSPADEHVFIRGNHKNPGPVVPRRFLEALHGEEQAAVSQGSGRLELAQGLTDDNNPFPARVAVNRVWQHLFGVGLVASTDNLGVLGARPSHPELLDYLADQFRRDGWSTKKLIRQLVLSKAYRMSTHRDPVAEELDPENRLLHRANVRRLEGEVIRDAVLAVSGRLQPEMYGPSIPVYLTEFMQGRGRPGKTGPLDGDGRRSIYQSVNRNFLSPFMLAFDTPVPATTVSRRSTSNVPAQALILLNNQFISEQSSVWAAKLLKQRHADLQSLINTAYREAFARYPSRQESQAIEEYANWLNSEKGLDPPQAWNDPGTIAEVCHVLLNQKEFLFLD